MCLKCSPTALLSGFVCSCSRVTRHLTVLPIYSSSSPFKVTDKISNFQIFEVKSQLDRSFFFFTVVKILNKLEFPTE